MQTIRRVYHTNRKDINYIRSTVESYSGIAVVKTLDPHAAIIEIRISPGCEEWVSQLLDYLIQGEGVYLAEKDVPETKIVPG